MRKMIGEPTRKELEAIIDRQGSTIKVLEINIDYVTAILNGLPGAVVALDSTRKILSVSNGFEKFFGYTRQESMGKNIDDLIVPEGLRESARKITEQSMQGEQVTAKTQRMTKEGKMLDVCVSASPATVKGMHLASVAIYQDMTEQKKDEEQRIREGAQEMARSYIGGMTHKFNNVLSAISMPLDMIRSVLDKFSPEGTSEKMSSYLKMAKVGVDRMIYMMKQMTFFGQEFGYRPKPISMKNVVNDALQGIQGGISPDIEVTTLFSNQIYNIDGDAKSLVDMTRSLIKNSQDAMPRGGLLSIFVENIKIDDGFEGVPDYVTPGNYVKLTFNDTGVGIEEENIGKIYDPFFSTKGAAGNGLGLSAVLGIVERHEGFVVVTSKPGDTCFEVYLPISKSIGDAIDERVHTGGSGGKKILVAEDEPDILMMYEEILTMKGYAVDSYPDGHMAIEGFSQDPYAYGMALLDFSMPRANGVEVMEHVKNIRPDMPVVICSGYSNEMPAKLPCEPDKMLGKPVVLHELLNTISEYIGPGNPDGST